ncbi:hypothetical protein CANMA_003007 [Candida margitis]|uniref:uncharacterized protein n=1 Tax=Candida margitis TaxID=1775924 RepID=UPI002226A02A|nr:uncharacterized protein CANMA_003007 [Candida margitis]KAI5967573.1 hypothetical protein CANMA_003007 [Candida margitis]
MAAGQKSLLTVVEDLTRVRSDVFQLQATFKKIMDTTPSWERYIYLLNLASTSGQNSGETLVAIERLKTVIFLPQTKVAVRLKQLYESGKLPLLTALSKINFKASVQEEAKQKLDILAFINTIPDQKPKAATHREITNVSDWKAIEYYSYPPTLPVIIDKMSLLRVSTDKSYRRLVDYVESTSSKHTNTHNAKLAIQGRAILKFLLLETLDDKFPNLFEEDLNLILGRLMSSKLLAKFAFVYDLVDPVKYNLSDDNAEESKLEICCDIFAAYIAGLHAESYELDEIKSWLNRLYEPLVMDVFATTSNPVSKVAVVEFQSLVKSVTSLNRLPYDNIQYETIKLKEDPFVAQIVVEGEVLGTGVSSASFDEARDRAAIDIMENKENGIRLFTIVKHSYLKNRDGCSPTNDRQKSLSQQMTGPEMNLSPSRALDSYGCDQSQSVTPTIHSPRIVHPLPGQFTRENDQYPEASQQMTRYGQSPPQQETYPYQPIVQTPYVSRFSPPNTYSQPQVHRNNFQTQYDYGYIEPVPHIPLSYKDIDKQAKTTLHSMLKARHSNDYEVTQRDTEFKTIEFHTQCLVDGHVLGTGVDTSKKNSAQKAAMAALSNKSALRNLGIID